MEAPPSYPSGSAYVEALQHRDLCFADPLLAGATVELTPLGLPRPRSGAAASVFSLTTSSGDRVAVKCFTRHAPDLQTRYAAIAAHLGAGPKAPWQVAFDYRDHGILVGGSWWPLLVMEWPGDVSGLAEYIEARLGEPAELGRVATGFAEVCDDLRRRRIAHGDLQHGNVLIGTGGSVRLIDYDGMWVPDLAGLPGAERGHPNFQSPVRTVADSGAHLDNFSAWVVYVSVLATAVDVRLWLDLDGGDECLLFRRRDFENPERSPALAALAASPVDVVRAAGAHLAALCRLAEPEQVPPLDPTAFPVPDDLPDRREIPEGPARPSQQGGTATRALPAPPIPTGKVPVVRVPPTGPPVRRGNAPAYGRPRAHRPRTRRQVWTTRVIAALAVLAVVLPIVVTMTVTAVDVRAQMTRLRTEYARIMATLPPSLAEVARAPTARWHSSGVPSWLSRQYLNLNTDQVPMALGLPQAGAAVDARMAALGYTKDWRSQSCTEPPLDNSCVRFWERITPAGYYAADWYFRAAGGTVPPQASIWLTWHPGETPDDVPPVPGVGEESPVLTATPSPFAT
ncbi:hypothetical protein [Cryptosporangium sp. NPDC051539]|uniref:hypothetical protein n=1 Tax=Cryptosporangium sp. NPDC051539 TaxID=3363962 RepID=UPI00378DD04E